MNIHRTTISFALALLTSVLGSAQTTPKFNLIYNFGADGGAPDSLTETSPGVFFGTGAALSGGYNGAVFQVDTAGSFKIVYQFPQFPQYQPLGGVQAMNGQYFGSGFSGPAGFNYQYFSMPLDGSSVNVYLTGGFGEPNQATFAIPSPDGFLYNTTLTASQVATFVKVDLLGNITSVHVFDPVTEGQPWDGSNLVRAADGSFYGISTINPTSSTAWFFRIDSNGN